MIKRDEMAIPAQLQPYSRVIALNDVRLHYYDAGSGTEMPLVLIHGLGDEADTWRHVLLPLSARRRVIALDLPGFGRSSHPRQAYTLPFFARTVANLLAALGIERAALAGSSLGAAVVQRLALARPTLVTHLVLIGGALPITPRWPPAQMWLFLTPGLGEAIYTSLRRSQDEAYATLRPYYHDLDALPAEDRAFLRERVWARVWSSGQRRAFLSTLRWMTVDGRLRAANYRQRLGRLTATTQLIWGEYDNIQPLPFGQAMATLLPDAQLRVIEGSGHLPQQERPKEVIALLKG